MDARKSRVARSRERTAAKASKKHRTTAALHCHKTELAAAHPAPVTPGRA